MVTWPAISIILGFLLSLNHPDKDPAERIAIGVLAGVVLALLSALPAWWMDRRRPGTSRVTLPFDSRKRALWFSGSMILVVLLKLAGGGGLIQAVFSGVAIYSLFQRTRSEPIHAPILPASGIENAGPAQAQAVGAQTTKGSDVQVVTGASPEIANSSVLTEGSQRALIGLSWRAFAQATALIVIAAASVWLALNVRAPVADAAEGEHAITSADAALDEAGEALSTENLRTDQLLPTTSTDDATLDELALAAAGPELPVPASTGKPQTAEQAEAEAIAAAERARANGYEPWVHVDDCSVVVSIPEEPDSRDGADWDAMPDYCRGKLHLSRK